MDLIDVEIWEEDGECYSARLPLDLFTHISKTTEPGDCWLEGDGSIAVECWAGGFRLVGYSTDVRLVKCLISGGGCHLLTELELQTVKELCFGDRKAVDLRKICSSLRSGRRDCEKAYFVGQQKLIYCFV